jgi:hypothetical protein
MFIHNMSYLINLAINALEKYKSKLTEDVDAYIESMQNTIENMDWEDVANDKEMCKCILAGLEILEQEGFKDLSIARIGDIRSMINDLHIWLHK